MFGKTRKDWSLLYRLWFSRISPHLLIMLLAKVLMSFSTIVSNLTILYPIESEPDWVCFHKQLSPITSFGAFVLSSC